MGVRIITDSTCDFSVAYAKEINVEMMSLKVCFGTEEYTDKVDITTEEFYEKLAAAKELPTTTLVNIETFANAFAENPEDDIVGIFLSPKLSGTMQSAVIAKEASGRDNIYLIDSQTITIGLSLLVREMVRLRDLGKSAKEIYDTIEGLKEKIRIYAIIDTFKYLIKGGRLSAATGLVGGMLGLKPFIYVEDGVIIPYGKARGMKNATTRLVDIAFNECDIDAEKMVIFGHTNNEASLVNFIEECKQQGINDFDTQSIGSIVGTHVGPGAIAIAFYLK